MFRDGVMNDLKSGKCSKSASVTNVYSKSNHANVKMYKYEKRFKWGRIWNIISSSAMTSQTEY